MNLHLVECWKLFWAIKSKRRKKNEQTYIYISVKSLAGDTRLYTSPCRSVRLPVRRSVTFLNCERFLQYCPCPTVRDAGVVYPALFGVYSPPLRQKVILPLQYTFVVLHSVLFSDLVSCGKARSTAVVLSVDLSVTHLFDHSPSARSGLLGLVFLNPYRLQRPSRPTVCVSAYFDQFRAQALQNNAAKETIFFRFLSLDSLKTTSFFLPFFILSVFLSFVHSFNLTFFLSILSFFLKSASSCLERSQNEFVCKHAGSMQAIDHKIGVNKSLFCFV